MLAMRAGSYHEGELWLRCPFCGDSDTHFHKAHFSINTQGVYHCFRCNKSGRLSMARLVNLYVQANVLDVALKEDLDLVPHNFKTVFEDLLPGPATSRKSALDRFQLSGKDAFLSRRPSGELVGIALVDKTQRRIVGNRAFGFKDELISDPSNPIRLVEGPYDVLSPRDICVYGSISVKHLQALKGHVVILCPDGDIWADEAKVKSLMRCFNPEYLKLAASIAWVERLEDDKDPAEVPYEDRWILQPEEVLERYG